MPKRPRHTVRSADPGLAWFDGLTCVLLRVFWRCVMGPIIGHDPSLPKAERVARLQRMIRALLYAEARLTRALHRAASRIAGIACPALPLHAYMRTRPRNFEALMTRIRELGWALRQPMRRARRLALRMKRALAAPSPSCAFGVIRLPRLGLEGVAACPGSSGAQRLRRRIASSRDREGFFARSPTGGAHAAPPESRYTFFMPGERCSARSHPHAPRAAGPQGFLHTKSAPSETAH